MAKSMLALNRRLHRLEKMNNHETRGLPVFVNATEWSEIEARYNDFLCNGKGTRINLQLNDGSVVQLQNNSIIMVDDVPEFDNESTIH